MVERYKNVDMQRMLDSLHKQLDRVDVIGYTAARNARILRDELTEFFAKRDELIVKHGRPQLDDEGNPTGATIVPFGTDEFAKFMEELMPLTEIEHEPALMKLKYEQAIGNLSGTDLLELDWMFED